MNHEVVGGVLNFFVHYDCFVYQATGRQKSMDGMATRTNIKEGGLFGNSKETERQGGSHSSEW